MQKATYTFAVLMERLCYNNFFAGVFAQSLKEYQATEQLDYMYEHIGHDSIVGKAVTESGFPDLDRVYECKPH